MAPDTPQDTAQPVGYCKLPRRLMIMLYDSLIMLGLLMVAAAIALPFGNTEKLAFRDFWFTLWLLLVCFVYLAGCWHSAGMTVGMRAWRVKIVAANGGKISWLQCLLRFLAGFVSIGALGIGLIWSVFDKKNRCWHDFAGRTLLIKTPKPTKKRRN